MTRCPPPADLARFLAGQSGLAFEGIEAHIEGCPGCQRALDELTRPADTAWQLPGVEPPAGRPGLRPPRVPGYVVCGPGRAGGHGVVFRAVDRALERPVALKVLRDGPSADPAARARLAIEARAVARLAHPGVVRVYGLAEAADGSPVVVMEWVAGGSLAARLDGSPLAPKAAAELARAVAEGAACAHAAGVLHRDIKPGNVLLPGLDLSNPKLGDFGLAKLVDAADGPTPTAAVLGTPAYLAPEVAAGGTGRATPAADVYALGAVLYELLTGRPPFAAATPFETAALARTQDPVRPRRLAPAVPRDLETVCLKCLEKDPRRRYPTARELADDLGRVLAGRPALARPPGPAGRATKWARRNPAVAASLALTAAVVAGSLATTTLLWRQAEAHRAEAEARAGEALARKRQAREAVWMYAPLAKRFLAAPDLTAAEWANLDRAVGASLDILDDPGEDPAEERKAAFALLQLADAVSRSGRTDRGTELAHRATAVLGRLAAAHPADPAHRYDYSYGCVQLAQALRDLGRGDEADRWLAEAVRVAEGLAAEDPADDRYRSNLADFRASRAADLFARGDPAGAAALLEEAAPAQCALLEKYHPDPTRYYRVGSALGLQARVRAAAGRPPEEVVAVARATADHGCRALTRYPHQPARGGDLLNSLGPTIHALDTLGRPAEADALVGRVVAAWEALARDRPGDATAADRLAFWCELDGWRRRAADPALAGVRFRRAAAASRRACDLDPSPTHAANLARLLATCPDPDVRRPAEAVGLARGVPGHGGRLALGVALFEAGDAAAARPELEAYREAVGADRRPDLYRDPLLYLAMARHRGGAGAEARALLRAVEEATRNDPTAGAETRALLARARAEIDPGPDGRSVRGSTPPGPAR